MKSLIGTVDLDIEGYISTERQRDLSIKFHWGHNHHFNDDYFIPGRMADRHVNVMSEFFSGFNLADDHFRHKQVLDIGCWTGGTTLMLAALGADNIVAVEEVKKYAAASNFLFNNVYNMDHLKCLDASIYSLNDLGENFNSVFCPGVIYHLSDPVLALRIMYNSLKEGGDIFIESAGYKSEENICKYDGNSIYHKKAPEIQNAENLNRGGWNWFLPSPACLELWLLEAGFDEVTCYWSDYSNRVYGHAVKTDWRPITRAGFSRTDVQ